MENTRLNTLNVENLERDKLIANATEVIDDVFEKLVLDNPVNQLPERIFKSTFLPFFTGEKSFNDDKGMFTTWIAIAGRPTSPVKIIDDAGTELFTVPPLYDTDFIDAASADTNFTNMAYNYQMRVAGMPQVGEAYLNNALHQSADKILTDDKHLEAHKAEWNKIFNYYNKSDSSKTATTDVIGEDEISYD